MQRTDAGVARADMSPLGRYGKTNTCRAVMRAYTLYRYNLLKSRYKQYGRQN